MKNDWSNPTLSRLKSCRSIVPYGYIKLNPKRKYTEQDKSLLVEIKKRVKPYFYVHFSKLDIISKFKDIETDNFIDYLKEVVGVDMTQFCEERLRALKTKKDIIRSLRIMNASKISTIFFFIGAYEDWRSVYQIKSDKVKGDKNPAYQHGGKLSPFSEKFVKYSSLDSSVKEIKIQNVKDRRNNTAKENPQNQTSRIEYYLSLGMSEDEAKEALSERQSTFSLKKCIERYGEEKGKVVWEERQRKWQESLKDKTEEEIRDINFRKANGWGYSKIYRNKSLKNTNSIVYWIRFFNREIEFYKIGITKGDVVYRFGSLEKTKLKYGLEYEILDTYNGNWLECFVIEQQILKAHKPNRILIEYNGFRTSEAFDSRLFERIEFNKEEVRENYLVLENKLNER